MEDEINHKEVFVFYLNRFNRLEPFHFLRQILDRENPYTLDFGPLFRSDLSSLLGVQLRGQIFVGLDYPLDWIQASLELARGFILPENSNGLVLGPSNGIPKTGSQDTIEMFAVFEDDDKAVCHAVMVEFKDVAPDNHPRLKRKIQRYPKLFAPEMLVAQGKTFVVVHHLFVTKEEPARSEDPEVVKFLDDATYMPLCFPDHGFVHLHPCNKDGEVMPAGEYWKVHSELALEDDVDESNDGEDLN